jgi:hypothetical protein
MLERGVRRGGCCCGGGGCDRCDALAHDVHGVVTVGEGAEDVGGVDGAELHGDEEVGSRGHR